MSQFARNQILLALLFGVVGCRPAMQSTYHYDQLDSEITILENGDLQVTETQKMVFEKGSFHSAHRWISLEGEQAIANVEVVEGVSNYEFRPEVKTWIENRRRKTGLYPNDDTRAFVTSKDGKKFQISWWYPESSKSSRTFKIKYQVRKGMQHRGTFQDLDWKAIFKHRSVPINKADVTVRYPWKLKPDQITIRTIGVASNHEFVDSKTLRIWARQIPANVGLQVQISIPTDSLRNDR